MHLSGVSNRRWLVGASVLAVLTLLLASCGGEEGDPVAPNLDSAPQVSSGQFDVTSAIIFDTCNETDLYNDTFDVTVDSLLFEMGADWTGSWDPKTATGSAESVRDKRTMRFCTITEWTEVRVTFSSSDEFTGEIIFRRRVNGDCGTPCVTTWRVTGTRM